MTETTDLNSNISIIEDKGIFGDIATAIQTTIENIKNADSTDAFYKVDIGMPTKIPLYQGAAAIIDLLTVPEMKWALRQQMVALNLGATVTVLTDGINTTSVMENYRLSWTVLKTLLANTHGTMEGLTIKPFESNCINFGVIPQNRIAIKNSSKPKLYYSGQLILNLTYSGDI